MADELHASLTPNIVNVGETLTVEIDSSAREWQNADLAIVRIVEVDDESPFEDKGQDKVVVTCEGSIADNVFSLAPAAAGKSNPTISTKAGPGVPFVKIEIGGTVFDVPLPNKDKEQGVFELRVELEVKEPETKTFTSRAPAMVRCFDHFTVKNEETKKTERRPVLAFITGGRDDNYIKTATAFWKLNADVVVSERGLSLEEILDMLDKEHKKFGNWGQINIVAHGSPHSINIKLFKDSEGFLHRDQMLEEIKAHADTLARPGGVDAKTQIVMRACNAGRDTAFVQSLHSSTFDGKGALFVPKFVQIYRDIPANEWFEESLTFDIPGTQAPGKAGLQAGLAQAWNALSSPGKGGDPKAEIPLFKANHDWVQTFSHEEAELDDASQHKPDGTTKSDADYITDLRAAWSSLTSKYQYHKKSGTWYTAEDRWQISVKHKDKSPAAKASYVFEVLSGTTDTKYKRLLGGGVTFGAVKGEHIWVVKAEGVAGFHFSVDLGPNPGQATVEDEDSGEPTFVGSEKLTGGASLLVKLPVTIKFGKAEVRVRDAKPPIDIKFECKRYHVDRRRTLRLYDENLTHDKRQLVAPKVGDPTHYGSS